MRLLLDTQIALWWLTGSTHLKTRTKHRISETDGYLSGAGLWEIAIKFQLGKLPLSPDIVRFEMIEAGVKILPILDTHVKKAHPKASILKGGRVVFNIKANDFRLIALIQYLNGILMIRFFGSHEEYDSIDTETV